MKEYISYFYWIYRKYSGLLRPLYLYKGLTPIHARPMGLAWIEVSLIYIYICLFSEIIICNYLIDDTQKSKRFIYCLERILIWEFISKPVRIHLKRETLWDIYVLFFSSITVYSLLFYSEARRVSAGPTDLDPRLPISLSIIFWLITVHEQLLHPL